MATPNYGYEKRQRELAKKRKKEEKLKAKAERKSHDANGAPLEDDESGEGEPDSPPGGPPAESSGQSSGQPSEPSQT